jgi:predicted enzyme related to lactoylglutathione lyase
MALQRTYPHGVTCWIDTEQPDPAGAARFYCGLLGWTLTEAVPPGAPGSYRIATLAGKDVAAIAPGAGTATWNTYVAVDNCDATTERVPDLGGTVTSPPADAGPGGRAAACADPQGAPFRLWQARRRLGAQLTNAPGTWNFSDLHTSDPAAVTAFYAPLFGWRALDLPGAGTLLQVPGYGDHLAATVDPDIHERQAGAPPGFADVIGGVAATRPGEPPRWHVTFSVAERDAAATAAERLGGTVLATGQDAWSRTALVRDPQGAEFTLSEFAPAEVAG